MPQIILLNHAAWFNGKQMEKRVKEKREKEDNAPPTDDTGKPLDDLDSAAWQRYYADMS